MTDILTVRHLTKRFDTLVAVDDVGFSVCEGELFAFLGVNGAGKSTTIRMLCGQLKRDGGEILIGGEPQAEGKEETKRMLGVVFQNSVLDKSLSVYDNLSVRAALYGITGKAFRARIDELDALFGIKDLLKRPVGKLSGGQRRRADIVRALLHRPKILILDEPTTGLDPQTRKVVWQAVHSLRKTDGLTVFLTTHYMEEAAEADHVVIIDAGKIVASGTPIELKNAYTGDFINVYGVRKSQLDALGVRYDTVPGGYRIRVSGTHEATNLIVGHPALFVDYEVVKGKMDDVFLAVTGKSHLTEEDA